jgi:2-phospho-L-lactate/phosphoenolpyruvate guanylyltransferase
VVAIEPLHVVIPLRSLAGGKARLGGAIDAEEREELLLGLLRQTLQILSGWSGCAAAHVVSSDPLVLAVAGSLGAGPVAERSGGLNPALVEARAAALRTGAAAVLLLPADLPLLDRAALDRLLEAADAALAAGAGRPLVVIAPSDARNGTNALLLSPPDIIEPAFGPESFERHVRAAKAADASLQVVADPALGFDLDTPEDLERISSERLEELLRMGRERDTPAHAAAARPGP